MEKEVMQNAPPLTVTTLSLFGVPMQEWVYVLTALYLGMQIGYFIYTKIRGIKWRRK